MNCSCCPRKCNKPRGEGFCRIPEGIFVSKFMIHKWEEPPISGKNGSGAVFFSGCNLRCGFCQNAKISGDVCGEPIPAKEFLSEVQKLLSLGADNINLVSPPPYVPHLLTVLPEIKKMTDKPIIYNSGGYDDIDSLRALCGLVDVYLPDFKYISAETAKKYSRAADYPNVAMTAIGEMLRQQPKIVIEDGLIKRGVIIRHLVLPGHRAESIEAVDYIARHFEGAMLSLMRQYTPEFNTLPYENLNRRVTSFEYESVLQRAQQLGIPGFSQLGGSASADFTPEF